MSTFYYWLPVEGPTNSAKLLERLRTCGLGYAVEDRITSRGCERGPDAMRGVVICNGSDMTGRLGYFPNDQMWKRVPGTDAWCGMYKQDLPKADYLQRADAISGEWIRTDDGNSWLIPHARRFVEHAGGMAIAMNLPRSLTLDDGGRWVTGGVKARYARLWDLASIYADAWAKAVSEAAGEAGGRVIELADDVLLETAIETIKTNYRVGAIELDMLSIFDQEVMWKLLAILIDQPTFETWAKKKATELESAGGSS
jgi:hypothetical protein